MTPMTHTPDPILPPEPKEVVFDIDFFYNPVHPGQTTPQAERHWGTARRKTLQAATALAEKLEYPGGGPTITRAVVSVKVEVCTVKRGQPAEPEAEPEERPLTRAEKRTNTKDTKPL
jgi:hypothetical protein